jgi:hypothetical protein
MPFDIYRKIERESWSDGVMECWEWRTVECGLGDCTADPPKDGSATVFKAEALRAQSIA